MTDSYPGSAGSKLRRELPVLVVVCVAVLLSLPLLRGIASDDVLALEIDRLRHAWFEKVVLPLAGGAGDASEAEEVPGSAGTPESDFDLRSLVRDSRVANMTRFSPDLREELDRLIELTELDPTPGTVLSTEQQFSKVRTLASYLEAQTAYAYQGLLVFLVVMLIAFAIVHRIQAVRLREVSAEREAARRMQRLALSVQEEERHRIARELHDETAQSLALARMIADQLDGGDDAARLRHILSGAMQDIRNVCQRMRPPSDWAAKPGEMIHSLCASLEERYPLEIHVSLRGDLSVDWDDEVYLHLYRIAQESLINIIRHAGTDEAWVHLEEEGANRIALMILDRGKGINGSEAGLGRRGIAERSELIGAKVRWFEPPEGGTGLSVTVTKQQRKTTEERNKTGR